MPSVPFISMRHQGLCLIVSAVIACSLTPNYVFCRPQLSRLCAVPRYGPPLSDEPSRRSNPFSFDQKQQIFDGIVTEITQVQQPEHIPKILTAQVDFLLSLTAAEMQDLCHDAVSSADSATIEGVEAAIDLILTFSEEFVERAVEMEDQNKKLLGRIIRLLASSDLAEKDREAALDHLMQTEDFSGGFLRHLENECSRIALAPSMTPESTRLLQILRMIQARVLEELGSDLGEAAQIVGQLIAYESKEERLAVLDAGLMMRGLSFAQEMYAVTQEALDGFRSVPRGADPDLVQYVQEIDERLKNYLAKSDSFE